MTEAEITSFVQLLAHSKASATTLADSYDDVLETLARQSAPFVDTDTFTPTDGTSDYSYPAAAVRILATLVSGKQLPFVLLHELEAYDDAWRTTAAAEGTPIAWTTLERTARTIRLFPTPDTTAADDGLFLHAETRTTDIPDWLALPIAFLMLADEFSYPSDHQDLEFAAMCASAAELFRLLTGI